MYDYVLCVTNLFAMATMATMCMVNFVKNLQTSEEKGHFLSQFYNIDTRFANLVCMGRSTTLLFKTTMLPNIRLIWLP